MRHYFKQRWRQEVCQNDRVKNCSLSVSIRSIFTNATIHDDSLSAICAFDWARRPVIEHKLMFYRRDCFYRFADATFQFFIKILFHFESSEQNDPHMAQKVSFSLTHNEIAYMQKNFHSELRRQSSLEKRKVGEAVSLATFRRASTVCKIVPEWPWQ